MQAGPIDFPAEEAGLMLVSLAHNELSSAVITRLGYGDAQCIASSHSLVSTKILRGLLNLGVAEVSMGSRTMDIVVGHGKLARPMRFGVRMSSTQQFDNLDIFRISVHTMLRLRETEQ